MQNELILEFPTKSMPSGFPRRGGSRIVLTAFSVGLPPFGSLPGLTGQAETWSVRGDLLRRTCLQMIAAALVKLLVRIAHGFRLAAAEHDLEVDGLQAVVLVAVNDAGRAGDALPGSEARGEAVAGFILHEHVEKPLQHKEALLDFVGVGCVALARIDEHDRQSEIAGRNDGRIAMLAGAAGADEAMLRALVALDLGILKRRPIRLAVAEPGHIAVHDLFDRDPDQFLGTGMPCGAHGPTPRDGECRWR